MSIIFVLILFILLFGVSVFFALVNKVLSGVFGLFGLKGSNTSTKGNSSQKQSERGTSLVRSELGAKRMRQFKGLAEDIEYMEVKDVVDENK